MWRCLLPVALLATACAAEPPPAATPDAAASPAPSSPAPSLSLSPSPTQTGSSPDPALYEQNGVTSVTQLSGREAAAEAGIDERGAVAGLQFRDANGVNTVVLRERPTASGVELLADHVAVFPQTEERRVLREVRDGVEDCEVDLTAEFLTESLEVRDADEDALGEVVFAYRLACRGDVSAAEQKLLLLEDGRKHILRGSTSTPYEPYQEPEPEPAAAKWPTGSYEWATDRFRELAPEFEPGSPTS